MRLRARLAVGIWHETGLFLEMLSRFPASSASSSILQAMREEETVPAGIGPDGALSLYRKVRTSVPRDVRSRFAHRGPSRRQTGLVRTSNSRISVANYREDDARDLPDKAWNKTRRRAR
jgi:hypothetical protein